jgi:hypothetical protein
LAVSKRPILYFADTGHEPYGLVEKKLNWQLQKITGLMHAHGA